jgi:Mg2+/citrate symporter
MHYDRKSALGLADTTRSLADNALFQLIIGIIIVLLVAVVLALSLRNREALHKIDELQKDADLLSQRVNTCARLADDLTDLEKRVTSVEAQFWE